MFFLLLIIIIIIVIANMDSSVGIDYSDGLQA
jgi:hypothetical protein